MELAEFAVNVGVALLLGTVIGAERQWRQHPAGLRTNALVAVGAALFVSLTKLLGDTSSPSRIAAYIVSGIGFLGGGVILKHGANIQGITTAATIWCSAAVGTLAGAGFGAHGAIGVVAVLCVVTGLRPLSKRIDAIRKQQGFSTAYRFRIACDAKEHAAIRAALVRHVQAVAGLSITGITARKKKSRKRMFLTVDLHADPGDDKAVQDIVNKLMIELGITSASWEKIPQTTE